MFVATLALPIVGLGALVPFVLRRRRRAARELSSAIGVDELRSGKTCAGELDGRRYEYEYYAGSRNRPSYFRVRIECSSPGEFKISPETRIDRLFKKLGISAELQTGDVAFDRDFYIHTNTLGFCRTCFASADVRESVRQVAALGYNEIRLDGTRLEAKCTPFSLRSERPAEFLEGAVRGLSELAAGLPREWYEPRTLGVPSWKLARGAVFGVSGLSLAAGVGLLVWGISAYRPLDEMELLLASLRYSTAALVALLVLAVVLLRGRSSSHRELLLSGALMLFGVPLTGAGGLMVWNGYADPSPPAVHEARVMGKRISRSNDSTTYHLSVESWRPGRAREDIIVSSGMYRRVRAGQTVMRVTTRAGRRGFEWVEGYAIRR